MKVTVTVKLKQRESSIVRQADGSFVAKLHAQPIENRANIEIIDLLANYYKVPKARVMLVRGAKSKTKVFEINTKQGS